MGSLLDRRGFLRASAALAVAGCVPGIPAGERSSASPVIEGTGHAAQAAARASLRRMNEESALGRLTTMNAIETAKSVASGEFGAVEPFAAAMTRLRALDPDLVAIAHLAFEREEATPAAKDPARPFCGVPMLVKDMVDCPGITRSDGAARPLWREPKRPPALIQALEQSGAVVLGSTNVPEFATLPVTANETFGTTRNPWDLSRTPGGSSGGSAVAVASGIVPIAHATDGSGSIRMPASCCGIFGFKPSRGRARSGEADGSHPLLKHHHCLSRTVADSAAFLSITEDRSLTAPYTSMFAEGWSPSRAKSLRRLRIGVDRAGIGAVEPDGDVATALEASLTLLRELGHDVVELPPLLGSGSEFWRHLEALFLGRMPSLIATVERVTGRAFDDTDLLSPFTMSFARAARGQAPGAVSEALSYFGALEEKVEAWMAGVDVLVSPVLPRAPVSVDRWTPRSEWLEEQDALRAWMNHTPLANVIGAPAMSVPLHWTPGGLPIGTHFQARPGDDPMLLELALELEAARPWGDRWPPIAAVKG